MSTWNRILAKIFSGKYFLTICCGIVFVYASFARVLNEATIAAIIVGVFKDYFAQSKESNGNGGDDIPNGNKGNTPKVS